MSALPPTPPPGRPASEPPPEPPSGPRHDAPPEARPDADVPPWPLWTVPAALTLGLGLALVGDAIVAGVARSAHDSVSAPPASFFVSLVFDLAFVGAALYFTLGRGQGRPVTFGYRRVALALGVGAFIAAAVSYYGVSLVYATLVQIHGKDKVPDLGALGTPLFVCVIAPVFEELFFRGFIFGTLRRWRATLAGRDVSVGAAALITGILFGLAHTGSASSQYLVPLGLLGFILCLLRWRTGSLYPCMALHSFNNAIAFGVYRHWHVPAVAALIAGALAVIALVTGPLAGPPLEAPPPARG